MLIVFVMLFPRDGRLEAFEGAATAAASRKMSLSGKGFPFCLEGLTVTVCESAIICIWP